MSTSHPTRILVLTDTCDADPELIEAISRRATSDEAVFRVVVLNPARAEVHLLHPERHDKAKEAEQVLRRALPELEGAAGGPIIGSVSVRHDPMDAIEEIIFSEPVDEVLVSAPAHHLAKVLHQDLQHRLRHFDLPVTTVGPPLAT